MDLRGVRNYQDESARKVRDNQKESGRVDLGSA